MYSEPHKQIKTKNSVQREPHKQIKTKNSVQQEPHKQTVIEKHGRSSLINNDQGQITGQYGRKRIMKTKVIHVYRKQNGLWSYLSYRTFNLHILSPGNICKIVGKFEYQFTILGQDIKMYSRISETCKAHWTEPLVWCFG